jgi:hypothetical protein
LAATDDIHDLKRALERLTSDRGDYRRECIFYRVDNIRTTDGHEMSVTTHCTHHRSRPAKANLRDIAEAWRINLDDLPDVLENWSADDLRVHLERHTRDQLLPLYIRRQRGIA